MAVLQAYVVVMTVSYKGESIEPSVGVEIITSERQIASERADNTLLLWKTRYEVADEDTSHFCLGGGGLDLNGRIQHEGLPVHRLEVMVRSHDLIGPDYQPVKGVTV